MRVNFRENEIGTEITRVMIGKTFLAKRKSKDEKALYMKVDKSSGLTYSCTGYTLAVNLTTGQLRKFSNETVVTLADTEVNFVD